MDDFTDRFLGILTWTCGIGFAILSVAPFVRGGDWIYRIFGG